MDTENWVLVRNLSMVALIVATLFALNVMLAREWVKEYLARRGAVEVLRVSWSLFARTYREGWRFTTERCFE